MRKKSESRKRSLNARGKKSSGVNARRNRNKKSVRNKNVRNRNARNRNRNARNRNASVRAAMPQTIQTAIPAMVLAVTVLAVLRQVQAIWNCYRQLSIVKLVTSLTKDNWR